MRQLSSHCKMAPPKIIHVGPPLETLNGTSWNVLLEASKKSVTGELGNPQHMGIYIYIYIYICMCISTYIYICIYNFFISCMGESSTISSGWENFPRFPSRHPLDRTTCFPWSKWDTPLSLDGSKNGSTNGSKNG